MSPILITSIVAGMLVLFLGGRFIDFLRDREVGQFVRAKGLIPEGHAEKQGTPTMGGLLILFACTVPFVILSGRSTASMAVLGTTLACGAIGFADDLMKVLRRRSGGLSGKFRMIALVLIAGVLAWVAADIVGIPTTLNLPIVDEHWEIGPIAFFVVVYLVVAGYANAVNLTDGLDGLAAGTVAIALLAYTGIAFVSNNDDLAIFGGALIGACVGFLWFNSFPASIFMGDTGSYALGGAIAAMSVMTRTEILLLIIGAIFLLEALSVMIQVVVFKRWRRRVFLMTPIHHHFEMAGWSETKIIVRFWLIASIFGAVGFTLFFRTLGA